MPCPIRTWGVAILVALASSACAETADDDRQAAIVTALTRADAPLLRSRPELVAGKYERMASDPYAFYRGSVPLFAADFHHGDVGALDSGFAVDGTLTVSTGDAHPENFGLLLARDSTLAFEPNDFDGADRYPFLWDVARLTTGLVIAARLSNPDDASANAAARAAEQDIAAAAAEGYAAELARLAAGGAPERIDDDRANPNLADLFRRGNRDLAGRDELSELTVLDGTTRRLRRGVLDPEEPTNLYVDLPRVPRRSLQGSIDRYRRTLIAPPPPEFFTVLDAARELGSGVASWPRVRVIVLVRGPTDAPDDDVLLELEELADSASRGWLPPGHVDERVTDRVLRTSRQLWARPDAESLWGVSSWMGFPVQVRAEREAHKTLRVSRMEDDEGTVDALTGIASILGGLLARMHASIGRDDETSPAIPIASAIETSRPTFVDRIATAAVADADRVESDWALFQQALADRGPILGWHQHLDDTPSPELIHLFGRNRP